MVRMTPRRECGQRVDERAEAGSGGRDASAAAGVVTGASICRSASIPSSAPGRSGRDVRGRLRSASGIDASASRPRRSSAMASGSSLRASNTAFTTRRWFRTPSAASSALVRAASESAERSGRVTSTIVVRVGSESASTVAWYSARCFSSPASGPRQLVPKALCSTNPVQAEGSVRSRSVCPVGAVSNRTWSNSAVAAGSPSSRANSSNAAISTVQAPESCSSMLFTAAGGRSSRYGPTTRSR